MNKSDLHTNKQEDFTVITFIAIAIRNCFGAFGIDVRPVYLDGRRVQLSSREKDVQVVLDARGDRAEKQHSKLDATPVLAVASVTSVDEQHPLRHAQHAAHILHKVRS